MHDDIDRADEVDGLEGEPGRIPLAIRLRAWWQGIDISALRVKRRPGVGGDDGTGFAGFEGTAQHGGSGDDGGLAAVSVAGDDEPADISNEQELAVDRHGKPLWNATRIEVAERMWGEGFVSPGGQDHLPDLVKPLGLNPAMSMLDLSAGLGGLGRLVAQSHGAWVTGLEANRLLAQVGMERSVRAGLSRQAPVSPYDPRHFSPDRRFDCVFWKEAFYPIENKDGLFKVINECLKPQGQLLFIDYFVAEDGDHEALGDWMASEPQQPYLEKPSQLRKRLQSMRFDLRVADDITGLQKAQIARSLAVLRDFIDAHTLSDEARKAVASEVNLWAGRVMAMEAGLRVYRVHALKPGEAIALG